MHSYHRMFSTSVWMSWQLRFIIINIIINICSWTSPASPGTNIISCTWQEPVVFCLSKHDSLICVLPDRHQPELSTTAEPLDHYWCFMFCMGHISWLNNIRNEAPQENLGHVLLSSVVLFLALNRHKCIAAHIQCFQVKQLNSCETCHLICSLLDMSEISNMT